ncbi:MAG: 50S ribosomal protein L13 [Candidatus Niyogibacteria bacterium]|nr:MAG: 50S ribosomal protein L13 [Candidatus Niyogibacteria bacterium]
MPETKNSQKVVVIDLKGASLGRASSAVAAALRGKNSADFAPNKKAKIKIEIKNLDQLRISDKKAGQKSYKRYSGYPSGLKKITLGELYKKNPKEVFIKAVKGMLPNNKLRRDFIKNIIFS